MNLKNETIEELLETFHMERSLKYKGCPYDNAVAEATFKIIKTEFVWNETFHTQEELKIKLWDYVNWYNHHRIHSSLGYQKRPVQYRKNNLKNLSEKVLTIHHQAFVTISGIPTPFSSSGDGNGAELKNKLLSPDDNVYFAIKIIKTYFGSNIAGAVYKFQQDQYLIFEGVYWFTCIRLGESTAGKWISSKWYKSIFKIYE